MFKTKQDFINKIHLIISVGIVVPVSFLYGFHPDLQFDIHIDTIDEHNFFKAIMALYRGLSILWTLGVLKNEYLKTALITNIIFMLGFGFGSVLSFFIDGNLTFGYQFGAFPELLLGFYGCWVLKRYNL